MRKRGLGGGALVAGALFAAVSSGCGPEVHRPVVDVVSPYVLGAEPSGGSVDVGASFTVRFSEPVKASKIFWFDEASGVEYADGIVLALAKDTSYVVSAVNSPPLSSTQRGKTVPSRVTLSADRTRVEVQPGQPLQPLTEYILVLSKAIVDDGNNKLVEGKNSKVNASHVIAFTTGPAPDMSRPTAQLRSPPAGASAVPADIARIEVEFSEAIDGATLGPDQIGLVDLDSLQILPPRGVQLEGTLATVTLDRSAGPGCTQLCTGASYMLFVSDEVRDLAGNPFDGASLLAQTFTAASCNDTEAPRIAASSVQVGVSDTFATVSWKTDEPSSTVVQYVQGDAALLQSACGASPTSSCLQATGPSATCNVDVCALPAENAFACAHQLTLTGLAANKPYALRVVSVDGGGRAGAGETKTFTTLTPQPRLVINEIFATPQGLTDTNLGKFVEIFNASDIEADLSPQSVGGSSKGWTLQRCADSACTSIKAGTSPWELKPRTTGGSLRLPGRAFAVVGGDAFDAQLMGVPAGALLLKGSTSTLLANGLTSTTAYAYALVSPQGAVVSTYGAHLGTPDSKKGKAFERVDPAVGDVKTNWDACIAAMSTAPGNFATPGLPNSVAH